VDLASLLQTDDLFQTVEHFEVMPVADLEHLLELPCCHPCSPVNDPALRGADLRWPPASIAPSAMPTLQPAPAPRGKESTRLPMPAGIQATAPFAVEELPAAPPRAMLAQPMQAAGP
jgi:hypothetical protein